MQPETHFRFCWLSYISYLNKHGRMLLCLEYRIPTFFVILVQTNILFYCPRNMCYSRWMEIEKWTEYGMLHFCQYLGILKEIVKNNFPWCNGMLRRFWITLQFRCRSIIGGRKLRHKKNVFFKVSIYIV